MSVLKLVSCCGFVSIVVFSTACGTEQGPPGGQKAERDETGSTATDTAHSGVASTSVTESHGGASGEASSGSTSGILDAGVNPTPSPSAEVTDPDVTDTTHPPSASGQTSDGAGQGSGDSHTGSDGTIEEPVDLSAEIYDPNQLPHFDIELSPEALDTLSLVTGQDDPRQDTYVSANLRYGDEWVTNIGLRIKGEGSFQQLDGKPAWKLKFDEFVPDQTFRGLKRMTLNNLFEDPSFVAERLAYDVYRAASLPAPRCNSALVYVNGEFYGVYANVEAEDKTFLRRWFQDVGGNLYEEGQADFVPGAETAFNLETNEQANDRSDLVDLIAAIDGATDANTFLDDIGTYLDTTNYLKFTAVEAAVNQWDMYSYTVFWVNNLRLYNDPGTGKFHFIPWGHDMSMKPYRDSGKPYVQLFELARQYDQPNGDVTSGLLLQRCLQSPTCVAAYRTAVEEVIDVYEELDLEARASQYYQQIKTSVYDDNRKRVCCGSDSLSNQEFETAYASVVTTIRGRTAALRENLAQP